MDTSRFTKPDDCFPLLDLTAMLAFKTNSSIAFNVRRYPVGYKTVHVEQKRHRCHVTGKSGSVCCCQLRRPTQMDCALRVLEFWKGEVKPRIVETGRTCLEDFPGGCCYVASKWTDD